MPQELIRTPLFDSPRTATASTGLTRELHSELGGTAVVDVDPGAAPGTMTPDGRAVLAAAQTSPAVQIVEPVSSMAVTVDSLTGAPPAPYPANEAGRPVFSPIVETSTDGTNWREAARLGPFYGPGNEIKSVTLETGSQLRIREAVGGTDAAVSYSIDLIA